MKKRQISPANWLLRSALAACMMHSTTVLAQASDSTGPGRLWGVSTRKIGDSMVTPPSTTSPTIASFMTKYYGRQTTLGQGGYAIHFNADCVRVQVSPYVIGGGSTYKNDAYWPCLNVNTPDWHAEWSSGSEKLYLTPFGIRYEGSINSSGGVVRTICSVFDEQLASGNVGACASYALYHGGN